jgi:hypothetical protein
MSQRYGIEQALRLTREAISLLDAIGAPSDLAAHLEVGPDR